MRECVRAKGVQVPEDATFDEIVSQDPDLVDGRDPAETCVSTTGLQDALALVRPADADTPNSEIAFLTFSLPHLGQVGGDFPEVERTNTSNPSPHASHRYS